MSNPSSTSCFSFLPFLPLDPRWLEDSRAFAHTNAALGKAYCLLVLEVWRRGGSIPDSRDFVARVTGLEAALVAAHWDDLTHGFECNEADGRLTHKGLSGVMSNMTARYGKEMESFAMAAALSVQEPQEFGLSVVEGVKKKVTRGLTSAPKGFALDSVSINHIAALGYEYKDVQEALVQKFIDFCQSRGQKYKDWQAAFRVFASREVEFRRPNAAPPVRSLVKGQSASLFGDSGAKPISANTSKSEGVARRNLEMLDRLKAAQAANNSNSGANGDSGSPFAARFGGRS